MTKLYVNGGHALCRIPVDMIGQTILCAGVKFVQADDAVEVVLLSDSDVEAMTAP